MKKGRHRRYEEARKFQRATAESFSVEDYDFDNSDRFGVELEDDESVRDDQYGHLADKYDFYDGDEEDADEADYASAGHERSVDD